MAINNINWTALNTLNGVINNACAICNEQNATDDAVMHLTNGEELTCSYSQADAPKSLTHFMFSRNEEQKSLNNQTRALFKQAVIAAFGNTVDDVPKKVRDAMNLSKFDNSGRPLTVRRMLAVRRAIAAETAALAKKLGFTGDVAGDVISARRNRRGPRRRRRRLRPQDARGERRALRKTWRDPQPGPGDQGLRRDPVGSPPDCGPRLPHRGRRRPREDRRRMAKAAGLPIPSVNMIG